MAVTSLRAINHACSYMLDCVDMEEFNDVEDAFDTISFDLVHRQLAASLFVADTGRINWRPEGA